MATTKQAASPKKSQGFQGIRAAFWVIVVCFIIAVCIFKFVLGNPDNFVNNDPTAAVKEGNILGLMYKGGFIVPIIQGLLLTVLALSVERWLALNTAFGKGSLSKFVANIKAALNANDFAKAQDLCNKQKGSVANVVSASLNAYKEMENSKGLKLSQKVSKIQQAHEEAPQLEMPTLQMNLPIIASIVTLGTLTGLLGTVIGMIRSFAALAAGIATSWFAVVSYNTFTNKIDKLTYALDEVGYSIAQTFEANHTEEA